MARSKDLTAYKYNQDEYAVVLHSLRGRYQASRLSFERLLDYVLQLLHQQTPANYVGKVLIDGRVKELDSARAKFKRKYDELTKRMLSAPTGRHSHHTAKTQRDALLRDPFGAMSDLVGVRCICLTTQQFDTGAPLLSQLSRFFEHTKPDRRDNPNNYRGVHFDCRLRSPSHAHPEHITHIVFELQCRTLSDHVWAESNHALAYKKTKQRQPRGGSDPWDDLARSLFSIRAQTDALFAATQEAEREFMTMSAKELDKQSISPLALRSLTHQCFSLEPFCLAEGAAFSPLWMEHILDGLAHAKYKKIKDVRSAIDAGRTCLVDFYNRPHETSTTFKPNDGTDILSKAIIFGDAESRDGAIAATYPLLKATRAEVEKILSTRRRARSPKKTPSSKEPRQTD